MENKRKSIQVKERERERERESQMKSEMKEKKERKNFIFIIIVPGLVLKFYLITQRLIIIMLIILKTLGKQSLQSITTGKPSSERERGRVSCDGIYVCNVKPGEC